MEHGVGGATHGDVERHGVEEGVACGDASWQHAVVAVAVVSEGVVHDEPGGILEEAHAVDVGGHDGAVAGQRETDGFGERVHRVGSEHAGTTAAARTGALLEFGDVIIFHLRVGSLHHGGDEVGVLPAPPSGLHGASADENGGDVEAHGSHQHAGGHLVAVGDAHHGIGLVRVDHVLHAVGDDVTRGQRVEHAVVTHGDAVVDGDGIELCGIAAEFLYLALHHLSYFVQVGVSRHKLREGIDHGDDGFPKLLPLHTGGHPQCPGSCHLASLGADGASQLMFPVHNDCCFFLPFQASGACRQAFEMQR